MSIKSTAVKNYINDCGVKTQIFAFAGYDPNATGSNATRGAVDLWNYSDFAVRVGKNSLCAVVPYVKWIQKRPYTPWSAIQANTGNYYAYNDQNGYVYLCISDNLQNRTDLQGTNISNIRPNHTSGIQTYSDGYTWKVLYKITPSFQRFITANWMPVFSFDTFDNSPKQTQLKITQDFCSASTGQTGNCGIYAKIPLSTDDDSGTIEYQIGDLFTTTNNITCSDCHYLMYLNEKFKSVFYPTGQSVPDSIEILDNYSLVESLIQTNQISQSSPYYYLYDVNENDNLDDGGIVSAFIDLSDFSASQLVSTIENPEFTITSNSGRNGRIRLKTKIYNNNYVIDGIEVISSGSYYKDIKLTLDSSILTIDPSLISAAVTINLDTIDGLGFDPVSVLDAQHVMIDSRIEKPILESSNIYISNSLNFFGMVENPISEATSGGNQYVSGSNYNVKDDVIFRTTVQARISNVIPGNLPDTDDVFDLDVVTIPVSTSVLPASTPEITSATTKDIIIGGISSLGTTAAKAELKNILYRKADYIVGATLGGVGAAESKTNNIIESITARPEFVQYSGKPVSTKKLTTDLTLSDTESVIIRINMIKGM